MTDEQLEIMESSMQDAHHVQGILVELQDYLDQIALMATIVSHYSFDNDHPGSDDLQVRMIGRLAEQGSKILRPAVEQLDLALIDSGGIVFNIKLDKMREQKIKTIQCQHCTNLLQVIKDEVLI